MGINCKIHYDINNEVEFVEDKNGQRSEVFDELRTMFGTDEALDLYALTESEDFIVKNPTVKDVMVYANSTEEELTRKETIDAIDMAVAFNANSLAELNRLLQIAFRKNGITIFDKKRLLATGFNEYEAISILSDTNLQNRIKAALPKLNNTDVQLEYDKTKTEPTSEIGIFGKQIPIVTKENTPQQDVMIIRNGEIVPKESDTLETLRKTYPAQPKPVSEDLERLFNTVANVNEDIANNKFERVQAVANELKDEVAEYGVDIRGIEDKVLPISNFKSFIQALESYVKNPTDAFAAIYDKFFDKTEQETVDQKPMDEFDIVLDTDLSEYELFKDFGLVRKQGNIYTKTSPSPLADLYNYYFQQQEVNKTKEEVQAKTTEMEVDDFTVDSDVLEAMYMWKDFLGYKTKTISNEKPATIDIKEAINNPYKKVTWNGIELTSNDGITKAKSELYEEQKEEVETSYDDNLDKRKEALKNKNSVEKIKTDYTFVEDEVLMTKNNTEQFVRTPLGVFEQIYQEGNLTFYKEVLSEEKNTSDIDYSKYFSMAVKPENIIEAKKYYTSAEIEDINNKHFNCN